MSKCAYCGAETELYIGGIAVCLQCEKKLEAKKPNQSEALRDQEQKQAAS